MTNDVIRRKQRLRESIRRIRHALPSPFIEEASARILRRLARLKAFREAETVACYEALPHEVQTRQIIALCWRLGKRVAVLAMNPVDGDYRFALRRQGQTMRPGPLGIPQPAQPVWMRRDDVDLFIVPGVAFDARGGRLGHGAGHFDRLLDGAHGVKVGVAFQGQITHRVPRNARDIPMDMIVTESRTYRTLSKTKQDIPTHENRPARPAGD